MSKITSNLRVKDQTHFLVKDKDFGDIDLNHKYEEDNNNLINWINNNGGFIHDDLYIDTKLEDDKIHRSIYYKNKENISKNSTLTQIPHKLVISKNTFEHIQNIQIWTNIIDNSPILTKEHEKKRLKIIIALLYEYTKKEQSFYYPYIKLLPKKNDFDNHPINIYYENNKAFKILNSLSKNFIKQVDSMSHELISFIEIILHCNDELEIFDKNIYTNNHFKKLIKWAFFIQKTRSWADGLVPFDDIFDHANNSNISLKKINSKTLDEDNHYIFKADDQFNEHKHDYNIFDNYGHYNSMRLLLFYNFLPQNEINYLYIPFKLNTKNNFDKLRFEEIKKCELKDSRILLCNNGPSKDLFTILRILCLTKNEYDALQSNTNKRKYEKIVSHENELKSVRLLLKLILDLKKSNYPLDNLNNIYTIINDFKNKKLSPTDLIIKNVCLITLEEYKIIDDSLNWINDILLKVINNSNITSKRTKK